MSIHQAVEGVQGLQVFFVFLDGEAQVSILVFVRKDSISIFPALLRIVENGPEFFDLGGFENTGH